jgi:hypothetical protein
MARIKRTDIYDYDTLPTIDDYVIGTDNEDFLRTKNYRIGDIVALAEAGGGASNFLALTDTPANYTGQAGNSVLVNGTEDGLEFAAPGNFVTIDTFQTVTAFKNFSGGLITTGTVQIDNDAELYMETRSADVLSYSPNKTRIFIRPSDVALTVRPAVEGRGLYLGYSIVTANSAERDYTFQNASGTVAFLGDLIAQSTDGSSRVITTVFNDLYNTVPANVTVVENKIGNLTYISGTIACQKNSTTATNSYSALFEIPLVNSPTAFTPITVWASNFTLEPSAVLHGDVDVDDKITLNFRIISAAGAGTGSATLFFSGVYASA